MCFFGQRRASAEVAGRHSSANRRFTSHRRPSAAAKKIFRPLSIPEQKIQRGSRTDEVRKRQEDEPRSLALLADLRVPAMYPDSVFLLVLLDWLERGISNLRGISEGGGSESRRPRHSFVALPGGMISSVLLKITGPNCLDLDSRVSAL